METRKNFLKNFVSAILPKLAARESEIARSPSPGSIRIFDGSRRESRLALIR